jgi:hypothetical protein
VSHVPTTRRNVGATIIFLAMVALIVFAQQLQVSAVALFVALVVLTIALTVVNPNDAALPRYLFVLMYCSILVRVQELAPLVALFFALSLICVLIGARRGPASAGVRSAAGVLLYVAAALVAIGAQRISGAVFRNVAVDVAILASAFFVFDLWGRARRRGAR